MKGNSQATSGNSLSPLVAQNQDLGSASQTLLTEFKSRGGDSHMKGAGMFVVSLSGVSSDFGLTQGGVLGKTTIYLAVEVSFRVSR